MKKTYEQSIIDVIVFDEKDTLVASAGEPFVPFYDRDDDDTEIL